MTEYNYSGPRVPRNAHTVSAVRRRATRLIEEITASKFNAAVADWAVTNDGPFPDRAALHQEAIREVEILCRGLDGWGAVDPDDVLGRAVSLDWPDEWRY